MTLKKYFNKKFKFETDGCQLPAESLFFASSSINNHEELQIIKSILNHVKSKLNDYQIDEWSRHTRHRNPAQQILHYLKNEIRGEFVTQAFAKFFECLSAYPIVNTFEKNSYLSVHLCEAPGAFITALNHYLKLHHPEVNVRTIVYQSFLFYSVSIFIPSVLVPMASINFKPVLRRQLDKQHSF